MRCSCRLPDTKKPATVRGRGLVVGAENDERQSAVMALLQLHSIFVGGGLLLGKAMNIPAAQ